MTTVRSIVAALLTDLTDAQDQANRRSAELSSKYRDDKILRFFPVPNALLDEVDINLRFSVDAIEASQEPVPVKGPPEAGTHPTRVVVTDIAAGIAAMVLTALRGQIDADTSAANRTDALALRRQLWVPEIRRQLTRNLTSAFHPLLIQDRPRSTQPEQEANDLARLQEDTRAVLQEALETTFGGDRDLAALVGPVDGWAHRIAYGREATRGDIGGEAASALAGAVRSSVDAAEPRAAVHIHLTNTSSDVPEYLIHSMRLHARLRNYKWVIVDDGDPDHDQLLPEN